MGYQKNIRNFLSESNPQSRDSDFLGIAGLSAPVQYGKQEPPLRTTRSEPGYVPKKRHGGAESYSYAYHGTQTLEKKRCYRVLTYMREGNSNVLVDIVDGSRIKDSGDKLNHDVVVFNNEVAAKSEKFASLKYSKTPRVLVAFECWGTSTKRIGGGSSSYLYENVKYAGIIKCLDVQIPFAKNHYKGRDYHPAPRQQSTNEVKVSRRI